MTNGLLFDFQLEFTFSDNWLADLDRQITLLLSTIEGTMPLERGLGIMQDFVDKPAGQGHFKPKVVITRA